jgi:hypothetical protein
MLRPAACAASGAALVVAACGIDAVGLRDGNGVSPGGADPASSGSPDGSRAIDGVATDATRDGGGDPTVPPPPLDAKAACGRPSVYVDDFGDGVPSTLWNGAAPGGSITKQNGNLILAYGAGAAATYAARAMVNLRDDRLRVALPVAPPSTARTSLVLRFDDTHLLSFVLSSGDLIARSVDGGPAQNVSVPFDPVAHRWWQIAETGGTTRWETSPDGIVWTVISLAVTPAFATTVRPVISASDDDGTGPAGEVRFAWLNAGRPVADWCKLSTFSDDFQDGQMSRAWEGMQSGACSGGESSGELRFSIGAAVGQCGWRSNAAYDLTSSAAYLEVPAITNYHLPLRFALRVLDITSQSIAEIGFVGSNELAENATGIAPMRTPYTGSNDRWWRVRESAGMIYWEASSNGTTWVEKRKANVPFAVTAVKILIGGETTAAMPGSISIGTPRFNLGP